MICKLKPTRFAASFLLAILLQTWTSLNLTTNPSSYVAFGQDLGTSSPDKGGNFSAEVKAVSEETEIESAALFWFQKTYESYRNGEYEVAIEHSENAMNIEPDYADIYNLRSAIFSKIGDSENAIKETERAIQLSPKNAGYYSNMGVVLSYVGDEYGDNKILLEAVDYFNRSIALDPEEANSFIGRSAAYIGLSRFDEAIADANKAIELGSSNSSDPMDLVGAYTNLASALNGNGNHREAIVAANKAIDLDPNVGFAYLSRGLAYSRLGWNRLAKVDLAKAEEL
ncbi:MAG: hypothetical protein AAFY57_15100, partial [Cyanobacteria bacterium J06642_2]